MSTKTLEKEQLTTIQVPEFLAKTIKSVSKKELKKRIITERWFTIAQEEDIDKKLAEGMEDIKAGRVRKLNDENIKKFTKEFEKKLLNNKKYIIW